MKKSTKTILNWAGLIAFSFVVGTGIAKYRWLHSQTYYAYQVQEGLLQIDDNSKLLRTKEFQEKLLTHAKDADKCGQVIIAEQDASLAALKNSKSCGDTTYLDVIYKSTDGVIKACQ